MLLVAPERAARLQTIVQPLGQIQPLDPVEVEKGKRLKRTAGSI